VEGEKAFCTDVLKVAKISYALALGGSQNPEGRTDEILTKSEHDSRNLIIVGGSSVNPVTIEFGKIFRVTYRHNIDESYKINAEGESIYLDLRDYPSEDICIIYLREYRCMQLLGCRTISEKITTLPCNL
jgi:hypothetical protein